VGLNRNSGPQVLSHHIGKKNWGRDAKNGRFVIIIGGLVRKGKGKEKDILTATGGNGGRGGNN